MRTLPSSLFVIPENSARSDEFVRNPVGHDFGCIGAYFFPPRCYAKYFGDGAYITAAWIPCSAAARRPRNDNTLSVIPENSARSGRRPRNDTLLKIMRWNEDRRGFAC